MRKSKRDREPLEWVEDALEQASLRQSCLPFLVSPCWCAASGWARGLHALAHTAEARASCLQSSPLHARRSTRAHGWAAPARRPLNNARISLRAPFRRHSLPTTNGHRQVGLPFGRAPAARWRKWANRRSQLCSLALPPNTNRPTRPRPIAHPASSHWPLAVRRSPMADAIQQVAARLTRRAAI